MNLVFVTAALPTSAVEAFLLPELLEAERLGHRTLVVPVHARGPVVHADARRLSARALPLLSLGIITGAVRQLARSPVAAARAARVLVARSRSPGVLLKNLAVLPKGLWLGALARAEQVDHIHAYFASTSASVAYVASAVSGVPWSFTAHRWDITEDNLLAEKLASARFARAIDERGKRTLIARAGSYAHKVRVVHVGVVVPRELPARRPAPAGALRVLIGARLVELKGHGVALEAVARLVAAGVAVQMDLAGDGPLRSALEARARALGVADRVTFLGLLDHQALLDGMRGGRWDVAVLPSLETDASWEGIPVFLIEAMAAGLPVVATRTGGIPELLEGGAGRLVPQRDPDALAAALAELATDASSRLQLGRRGFERVQAGYDVTRVVPTLAAWMSAAKPVPRNDPR